MDLRISGDLFHSTLCDGTIAIVILQLQVGNKHNVFPMHAWPLTRSIFLACLGSLQEKVVGVNAVGAVDGRYSGTEFWTTGTDTQNLLNFGPRFLHLQPPGYYDADIFHKWLLQVGNSHIHSSHCRYKCLLHCCALMSFRKTFVSARADTRRRPGVSCDQIVSRTVFPISCVKQFSVCQERKRSPHAAHVLWGCCVFTWLPAVLTSNLWERTCNRIMTAVLQTLLFELLTADTRVMLRIDFDRKWVYLYWNDNWNIVRGRR